MTISVIQDSYSAEIQFRDTTKRRGLRAWVDQKLDLPPR
jgi:hypothetical protein